MVLRVVSKFTTEREVISVEFELPVEEPMPPMLRHGFVDRQQFPICGRVVALCPFELLRKELDSVPLALRELLEDRANSYQRSICEDSRGGLHIP